MNNFTTPLRTIQHPGFEFNETDLSISKTASMEKRGLFIGFTSQGPIGTPTLISSEAEFINTFGAPQNFAEFYLYKGVSSILDVNKEDATAIVIRLPYNNSTFDSETLTTKFKALKYKIKTDNSGLVDFKQLFKSEPSFKNLSSEIIFVNETELEEFESQNTSDFIIYNKQNSQVNDGSEILISVLGRSNALTHQGFISKAPIDIFNYESFNVINNDTVGRQYWDYNVIDSINTNLLRHVPEIKTVLVKDEETGFYNRFVQQDNTDNQITVVVLKVKKSITNNKSYTLEILESFTGSLFKDDIDPLSRESCYIGDIINSESNYIGFTGHKSYKGFKKNVDEIFVRGLEPLRIALSESDNVEKKIFNIDSNIQILKSSLENVANLNFTDIFDCGTSDIVSTINEEGFYNPESTSVSANIESWLKWTRVLGHFCKYSYPYCVVFLDLPKSILLKGQLSRLHELGEYEDEVVNAELINSLAIQDNSYTSTNCEWVKVANSFLHTQQYIPSSCLMPKIVNNLEEYYIPPAGLNYGKIDEQILDVAIIPNFDTADILYNNRINYISCDYRNNALFFDGQKTNWNEDYQLNRINVRRLTNYLKKYTIEISKKYIGEVNNVAIRESFKSDLESEFERITLCGGLDSYSIDVGSDINSQLVIDNNELRVKIIIKPVSCIEFVLADFLIH